MKYFDTHAHITSEYYDEATKQKHIKNAQAIGVNKIILPGCTEDDSYENIKTADNINIFAAAGIHPNCAKSHAADFLNKIDISKIVAIGECGLDFHFEDNPSVEIQKEIFEYQLKFAIKNNLVVIIHLRDALQEGYDILSKPEYKGLRFVMHSFSGDTEWSNKFLNIGAYISLSGIVTFKNAQITKEVAKHVPLNRLVTETDAPYLTPAPNRGKPNLTEYVKYTADYIASIRTEKDNEVLEALFNNAMILFNIK